MKDIAISRLKKEAKKLKKLSNIPHFAALDFVAQQNGYSNYKHFLAVKLAVVSIVAKLVEIEVKK
jgi:hypothetical protein